MSEACTCHRRGRTDEEALGFEVEVARSAMRAGDLGHARHHVAGALGLAPADARVHTLFDELAARLDLTSVPDRGWYGDFALAAFALRRAGDLDTAIDILADVTAAAPNRGFEHALTSWCAERATLDPGAAWKLAKLLVDVNSSTIGLNQLLDGERHLLGSFAGVAEASARLATTPDQLGGAAGLFRRLGRVADSLELAQRVPGAPGQVMQGLAHRAAGDGLSSLAAFELAERLDPGAAYAVERARASYVAGETERAAGLLPIDSQDTEVAALRTRCARPEATASARVAALDAIRRSTATSTDFPHDATANVFSQLEPGIGRGEMSLTVSGWESPTNRLLAALFAGHCEVDKVSYTRTFTDFERPVMAQRRGAMAAWVERGGVPCQAFKEPSADLRSALANASEWTVPSQLAEATVFATVSVKDLIAAMVHPPTRLGEDAAELPENVFDYQVACAVALTSHGPGAGLDALESLIFGPVDWVSAAAVVALGEWTHRSAAVAHKGRALLLAAIDDLLPHNAEPRFFPLLSALLFLPGVPQSANEALRRWYGAHLGETSDGTPL